VLERTFTIRANEGFVTMFAPALVAAMMKAAPRVRLRFAPKPDKAPPPCVRGTSISRSVRLAHQRPKCAAS
jgi:hypothetical protein